MLAYYANVTIQTLMLAQQQGKMQKKLLLGTLGKWTFTAFDNIKNQLADNLAFSLYVEVVA